MISLCQGSAYQVQNNIFGEINLKNIVILADQHDGQLGQLANKIVETGGLVAVLLVFFCVFNHYI